MVARARSRCAHSGRREVGGSGGAVLAHPHPSSPEAVESDDSAGGMCEWTAGGWACMSVSRATWTTCERSGLEGVACRFSSGDVGERLRVN